VGFITPRISKWGAEFRRTIYRTLSRKRGSAYVHAFLQ